MGYEVWGMRRKAQSAERRAKGTGYRVRGISDI